MCKGLQTVGSNFKGELCNERFAKGLSKGANQNAVLLMLRLLHEPHHSEQALHGVVEVFWFVFCCSS